MSEFWQLVTTAQVSTALVIIAVSLGVIAIKLTEKKRFRWFYLLQEKSKSRR